MRDRQRRQETLEGMEVRRPQEPPGVAAGAAARTALTRGPGGVAQYGGSSRPAAAAARAATHHAAALMAGPGGPGSARFRSARAGRAGLQRAMCGRQQARQKREPDAPTWTAERNDPGTGPDEVKAQHLRTSVRAARGFREEVCVATVAVSSKTKFSKPGGS